MDSDPLVAKHMIEKKGWKATKHYHIGYPGCSVSQTYQVKSVPYVVLVNAKGVIVFKGKPSEIIMEEEIDRLVKESTGVEYMDEGEAERYEYFMQLKEEEEEEKLRT